VKAGQGLSRPFIPPRLVMTICRSTLTLALLLTRFVVATITTVTSMVTSFFSAVSREMCRKRPTTGTLEPFVFGPNEILRTGVGRLPYGKQHIPAV